jgi:ABC-type uncharacterized transport system auxiliary subunit
MKMRTVIFAIFSVLMLEGCSGFKSSAPPPDIYTLQAPPVTGATAGRPSHIIAVTEPEVPAGFETEKIAVYLQDERRMDYAAHASWPGPLPKVLQQFIAESASGMPGVIGVLPESGIPASSRLAVRVNDFEPVYKADVKSAPLLKVSLTFTLMTRQDKIGTSFTVAKSEPATANSLTVITGGLEKLAREITSEALWKMNFAPRQRHQTRD